MRSEALGALTLRSRFGSTQDPWIASNLQNARSIRKMRRAFSVSRESSHFAT